MNFSMVAQEISDMKLRIQKKYDICSLHQNVLKTSAFTVILIFILARSVAN